MLGPKRDSYPQVSLRAAQFVPRKFVVGGNPLENRNGDRYGIVDVSVE